MKTSPDRLSEAVFSVSDLIVKIIRGTVFSIITVPATVLFMSVLFLSLDGSLSKLMLDTVTSLTADAPAGKVMICQRESTFVLPSPDAQPLPVRNIQSVPSVLEAPCDMQPLDINDWAEESDSSLRQAWLVWTTLGALFWIIMALRSGSKKNAEYRYGISTMHKEENK